MTEDDMTDTTKEVEAPKVELNAVFAPLPDNIKLQISTLPPKLNPKDERGQHLSPLMGRLIRAIRAANGGVSQKELAEHKFEPEFLTTHCQIATLEQGGCKKGATTGTIKLLAHAVSVEPTVIEAINKADLEARVAAGDEVAKKVLGIKDPEPEPAKATGTEVVKAEDKKDDAPKPTPTPPAAKKATPAAKKATAPAPKPEARQKDTVPM
jgi:hypothetical protein